MSCYNRNAAPQNDISVGSQIELQNREAKLFDTYGVVIDLEKFEKYVIKIASGRILTRNLRFIRKRVPNSSLTANHNRQNDNIPPDNLITSRFCRNETRPRRLIEEENWP